MNRFLIAAVLCLAVIVGNEHAGHAATSTYWAMHAGSCTPIDTAIQGDLYYDSAGTVKHKSTPTATITLYCPVEPNAGGTNPTILGLVYQDPVADANNNVTVALWKMDNFGGGITQIASLSSTAGGTGTKYWSTTFTHTLDFVSYSYFIRVDIKRNSTLNTEILYTVLLQH